MVLTHLSVGTPGNGFDLDGRDSAAPTFDLRGLRVRIFIDNAHAHVFQQSIIAGFVFLGDCNAGVLDPASGSCAGGSFADVNAAGFGEALRSFARAAGLLPVVATSVRDAVVGSRDLRTNPEGLLTPCTGPDTTSTNSNAVSFGLAFDSQWALVQGVLRVSFAHP